MTLSALRTHARTHTHTVHNSNNNSQHKREAKLIDRMFYLIILLTGS